jgi:hypothetical protein
MMMRAKGTAIIIKDSKVLLVKAQGKRRYSLPARKLYGDEPSAIATARRVSEELGLGIRTIKRLPECDIKGFFSEYKVCLVEVIGEPYLIDNDLNTLIWWDIASPLPVYKHVTHILEKIRIVKKGELHSKTNQISKSFRP